MYNKGTVFNIQRFSTSDGPGIRTVVFLKGCPLNCAWCHNPESKSAAPELFFDPENCIGCGACVEICEKGCHRLTGDGHAFARKKCARCMSCLRLCPTNALSLCGEEKGVEEILDAVLRDNPFYETSGGGLTLSGGEPLFQFDFSLSLLQRAKEHGLHTAMETSGFTSRDLTKMREYVDLWLYDIKLFSEEEHIQHTGVSNRKPLENLAALNRMGAKIILRCPIIPAVNFSKEHFREITRLANRLEAVVGIHLEAYHPLGISKAHRLGKEQTYSNSAFLDKASLTAFADELREHTGREVKIL